jgi:hypothetical protein
LHSLAIAGKKMRFDFGALERLWLTSIEEAISMELRRGERLYAIAFWFFHGETGAVIAQPMVGLGVETALGEARFQTAYDDARAEGRDAGFASLRWNPADWEYDILVLPRADAIEAAYTALATEACGMDPEEARHADDDRARSRTGETQRETSIRLPSLPDEWSHNDRHGHRGRCG